MWSRLEIFKMFEFFFHPFATPQVAVADVATNDAASYFRRCALTALPTAEAIRRERAGNLHVGC